MAYEDTENPAPPPEDGGGGVLTPEQLQSMTPQQVAQAVRGRVPTVAELRAMSQGQSEDFGRFSDAQVQAWLDSGLYDVNVQRFHSAKTDEQGNPLEGWVDKPDETPEGWYAYGENFARRHDTNYGGGGEGPAAPTAQSQGPAQAAPFDLQPFQAPSYEDLINDPGFQFRLQQGREALEGSAAARGTLRTGGTLQGILDYGQDLASQEYGNAFNRALQGWQANYQPWQQQFQAGENRWQTEYGGDLSRWQTRYGGDLQKYLQRENNIFGLLNQPTPSYS